MSEGTTGPGQGRESIRFDTAEFTSPESVVQELSCSACSRPLIDVYYDISGRKLCPECKDAAVSYRTGSGVAAFFRAWLYGAVAGIAGCGLYFAVLAISGYEVGLIAIVVGLMIGIAVRKGSRYRGGWLYQAMAMIITYGSIVTSFVPGIIQAARGDPEMQVPLWFLIVSGWILAWFAPFLTLPQSIIGLFIIGIGVYEAWKINKRVPIVISGPYPVSMSNGIPSSPPDLVEPPPHPTT